MWTLHSLGGMIGQAAAKLGIVKPAPTPVATVPVTKKIPLKSDQYYQAAFAKKFLFLHHTAGSTASGAMASWAADPARIATPYVIDRDGTIYETYDPKYWAYHLGVKGMTSMEKASIGIEIVSWGQLLLKNGKYITYTGRVVPIEEVSKVKWRGFDYYHEYTPEQIASLRVLIPYLMERFKIPLQPNRNNFWEYQNPATLPAGIWSHTTVRRDKVDIFPQPEITELVLGLK